MGTTATKKIDRVTNDRPQEATAELGALIQQALHSLAQRASARQAAIDAGEDLSPAALPAKNMRSGTRTKRSAASWA